MQLSWLFSLVCQKHYKVVEKHVSSKVIEIFCVKIYFFVKNVVIKGFILDESAKDEKPNRI